jgi:NAD+ diphosphatase
MSNFFWPEPDFNFVPGVEPGNPDESLYFICHKGGVLKSVDADGQWQAAGTETLARFAASKQHFMGQMGQHTCVAVEVEDPGSEEFLNLRMFIGNIDTTLFNLAGRAIQLCDWHRTHQYCGQCGAATLENENDRSKVCETCRMNFYPRLSPSIIVLVHRGDDVLLGRNHMFPEGMFSTLAGFVEPGESIEETVKREVKEEVGVTVGNLSYRGSQPWPFPNSLMLGFHAEYESGDIVLQEDEIAEANWYACDDLPMIPGKFAISRWLIDEYLDQRGFPI